MVLPSSAVDDDLHADEIEEKYSMGSTRYGDKDSVCTRIA